MKRLTAADGMEICYRVRRHRDGPSPAMLLIHGAASNHTRWSEFARHTELRNGYDLILPDMRGNAGSMCRGRLDLDVWCEDLVAILDAENYDSAIVVGHSLGAQIAFELARHQRTNRSSSAYIMSIFWPPISLVSTTASPTSPPPSGSSRPTRCT